MRMFKYIIFVYIFVYQEAILARSNALDDYWKEQDKVAFSTHQDSDGLTIVLSKKEDPIKPLKAVQNKYSHKNKNKKIMNIMKHQFDVTIAVIVNHNPDVEKEILVFN